MGYVVWKHSWSREKRKHRREVEAGDNRKDVRKKEVRARSGYGPMF